MFVLLALCAFKNVHAQYGITLHVHALHLQASPAGVRLALLLTLLYSRVRQRNGTYRTIKIYWCSILDVLLEHPNVKGGHVGGYMSAPPWTQIGWVRAGVQNCSPALPVVPPLALFLRLKYPYNKRDSHVKTIYFMI